MTMGNVITLETGSPRDAKRPEMSRYEEWERQHLKEEASRAELFLKLPLDVMASKMYLGFVGTTEAQVWNLLCAYIRRGPSVDLGNDYYEEYYLKQKKLVSRWNQNIIAEKIGLSKNSKGCISRAITRLAEDWKFITIHKEQSYQKTRNLYELGYWEIVPGEDRPVETLYLVERIRELDADLANKKVDKAYTPEEYAASDTAPLFGDTKGSVGAENAEQRG